MKRIIGGLAAMALTGLGVAACAFQPAPLGPKIQYPTSASLSAVEIRDGLSGRTGTGPISGSKIQFSMYLAPDGTAQAKRPTGVESGSWTVTDSGLLCMRWQVYRGGEEYCQRVYRDGGVYTLVSPSSIEVLAFEAGKRI